MCVLYADDELIYLFLYLPDSPLSLSLLVLYILLGVLAGALVLCWCCWSPGWFVWRVSICRFLPCCNSVCASCQLCARSCTNSKEHRLAKVTPHTPTNGASAGAAAVTHSADENVNMSSVWRIRKHMYWVEIIPVITHHWPGVVYGTTRGEKFWLHCAICVLQLQQNFLVFLLSFNGEAGCSVTADCIRSVIIGSEWQIFC